MRPGLRASLPGAGSQILARTSKTRFALAVKAHRQVWREQRSVRAAVGARAAVRLGTSSPSRFCACACRSRRRRRSVSRDVSEMRAGPGHHVEGGSLVFRLGRLEEKYGDGHYGGRQDTDTNNDDVKRKIFPQVCPRLRQN